MNGFRYGLVLGLVMAVLIIVAPQPAGSVVAFTLIAAQAAVGAVVLWRRTGLKYATASLITGAAGAALLAYLAASGAEMLSLSAGPIAALVLLVAGIVLFGIEARVNPEKWQAWRDCLAGKSVADMLLGRHIPHLR